MDGIRTTELHPDGECKQRPPHGETPGEGTRAGDKDPPPHTTAGKARARHRPKRHGKETEGGGHAKGTARGHTTNRPQPRGAGNHTAETGGGGTTHSPHTKQGRQTTPAKARTGTQTHHQHTAHTPERAHNTHPHNRHRHEPHKRTPHTKAQAPPALHTQHTQTQTTGTQQPPLARGAAGPPETARTQRRTHEARSREWRTATPSNTRTATPNTRTGHYDTHTSTATNAQTGRHDTLTSGHTRNQRRHHRQHQRPQHPPKH